MVEALLEDNLCAWCNSCSEGKLVVSLLKGDCSVTGGLTLAAARKSMACKGGGGGGIPAMVPGGNRGIGKLKGGGGIPVKAPGGNCVIGKLKGGRPIKGNGGGGLVPINGPTPVELGGL